jgi:hypothetical protein
MLCGLETVVAEVEGTLMSLSRRPIAILMFRYSICIFEGMVVSYAPGRVRAGKSLGGHSSYRGERFEWLMRNIVESDESNLRRPGQTSSTMLRYHRRIELLGVEK